jgi:general secretion pathway protein L
MADNLVLRLRDSTDACSWVVVDADGRLAEPLREGDLDMARAAVAGRRLIVLVPGSDVITSSAELPQVSRSRLRQVLPFSLEENFAEDVSELHFAIGERAENGRMLVSVVARERLDAWLERLARARLDPVAVYADSDGVADTPSTLTVIAEDTAIYARRPGEAPVCLAGLSLGEAFDLLTAQDGESAAVQHALICMSESARQTNAAEIEKLSKQLVTLDVKLLADSALALFAARLVNHPGTNLLQGRYAAKSNWGALLKPWRIAAGLAAGLVATLLVGTVVEYVQLRRADAALTSTLEARCGERFGAAAMRQCEAELQARLRTLGETTQAASNDFLATLAQIAATTGDEDQLQTLSYRNGVMDVQILMPSVPALDEFSRRVNESGQFTVSVQSTNPRDDGVEARIQILGGDR